MQAVHHYAQTEEIEQTTMKWAGDVAQCLPSVHSPGILPSAPQKRKRKEMDVTSKEKNAANNHLPSTLSLPRDHFVAQNKLIQAGL